MTEPDTPRFDVVGRSETKVDAYALVTGKPVFAGDIDAGDSLHLAFLHSPHAHARITSIDVSRADALDGVALVLTHENTPGTMYTTAGQGYPEPSPYDTRMLTRPCDSSVNGSPPSSQRRPGSRRRPPD
jgi:CO/xanthine dehydrogenase Mo-binding subunit